MKNKYTFIAVTTILLLSAKLNSQVIISQDFEGPLTGWTNQGSLVSTQNSITAHSGGGMLALSTGSALTSPTFALPGVAKNLTFWLNSFNDTPFGYSFTADLLQNGSTVLALGSWQSDIYSAINPWSQKAINIPSGFNGSNYSLRFSVQSFTNPNLRFYLDDISLGFGAVSVTKHSDFKNNFNIINNQTDHVVQIFSSTNNNGINVSIYSIDGALVYLKNDLTVLKSSPIQINTSSLRSGIYLIKLSGTNGEYTQKILF